MITNDFIKELRKVSSKYSEFNIEEYTYNGFKIDAFGVIEYEKYIDNLYIDYFNNINDQIDNLLLHGNNQTILKFLNSKINRFNEINSPIEQEDKEVSSHIEMAEDILSDAIHNKYPFCDNCYGPDTCQNCQKVIQEKTESIRKRKLNQDFLNFNIDVPTYCSALRVGQGGDDDETYFINRINCIGREYIRKSYNNFKELCELYRLDQTTANKKTTSSKVRTEKDFRSYLHHDNKDVLMEKLHELLDNEKGKVVAITIKALEKIGCIAVLSQRAALYRSMENEFGYIGAPTGLNNYYNDLSLIDTKDLRLKQLNEELQQQIDILSRVK